MKIKQALVELLLKYLELKFLHHVLYQPPPTFFWLPLWFGKMPDFYLIGKVGFKVSSTELMPDGPRGPRLFLGETELVERERHPLEEDPLERLWPVHTRVIFPSLLPAEQREEILQKCLFEVQNEPRTRDSIGGSISRGPVPNLASNLFVVRALAESHLKRKTFQPLENESGFWLLQQGQNLCFRICLGPFFSLLFLNILFIYVTETAREHKQG